MHVCTILVLSQLTVLDLETNLLEGTLPESWSLFANVSYCLSTVLAMDMCVVMPDHKALINGKYVWITCTCS